MKMIATENTEVTEYSLLTLLTLLTSLTYFHGRQICAGKFVVKKFPCLLAADYGIISLEYLK
jgi:hypothetical protein